jgi:undecaprenyl phosphate-alpha-L-ara4N flippase subunit ArnE
MNLLTALLLIVAATLLSATGMLFLKMSASRFRLNLVALLTNWRFLLAGFLYALSMVFYVLVLREVPISVAYPLTSMNYIWAALLSKRYLKENVDVWRWSGIGLIIVGIVLLAI